MTIEEYIKKEMVNCPLTKEQEGALIKGIENYLDELELKNLFAIPRVIARFLRKSSDKHKVDINKIMVGMQYGDIQIWRYDTGAHELWKTLEIVPKNEL